MVSLTFTVPFVPFVSIFIVPLFTEVVSILDNNDKLVELVELVLPIMILPLPVVLITTCLSFVSGSIRIALLTLSFEISKVFIST